MILIILIIHIIVSYDQNISLIFYVKMDSMSGCGIRLVFTFPPKASKHTAVQKMRTPLKNFPCISTFSGLTFIGISLLYITISLKID